MSQTHEEVHLSKLETVLAIGIIGCLLLATWELGHLMADEWLKDWVQKDSFTNRRIILYGIAFVMAAASLVLTALFAFKLGRFGQTIGRAFLWYGILLLISTIAIFVFDCLPEVFAGFIGAAILIAAVFIFQKRFFTKQRITRIRLAKGRCPSCGSSLQPDSMYCAACGVQVGRRCEQCDGLMKLTAKYCARCGRPMLAETADS